MGVKRKTSQWPRRLPRGRNNTSIMQLAMSLLPLLLAFAAQWTGGYSCRPSDMVRGCKIQDAECFCDVGCRSEFKYSNKDECKGALKNTRRWDACTATPCANGGLCTQIQKYYRCRCEGTGYYGARCQYPCPIPGTTSVKVFPYECVLI